MESQDVVAVLAVEALRDIGLALLFHINTKDGQMDTPPPNASEALDRRTS